MTAMGKRQPSTKRAIYLFFPTFNIIHNMSRKKNTIYSDNHKTTRLAGQFNSLYISIFSQEVLNTIKKPAVNEGDQETSGTSFNRLRTCLKQRNQLLILHLQNSHTTEYISI